MGTRHFIGVKQNGAYKVAQYGQWDGYPEGQGKTCLNFARTIADPENREKFAAKVRAASFITPKELEKLWKQYGADEKGYVSCEDADRMKQDHPEYSRDTGGKILSVIMERPDGIALQNEIGFAADSLFCEYAWVIDLDAGTFEGFKGFNTSRELTSEDRFYFLRDKEDDACDGTRYHGVTLVAKWPLDKLPTDEEMYAAFAEPEEEDPELLEDSGEQTVTVSVPNVKRGIGAGQGAVKAIEEGSGGQ